MSKQRTGRTKWFIGDEEVVRAIQADGWYCERSGSGAVSGITQIATGTNVSQVISASGATDLFETDFPIPWNGKYTLPDGRTIQSSGTDLSFVPGKNTQMVRIYYLTDESFNTIQNALGMYERRLNSLSQKPGDAEDADATKASRVQRILLHQQPKHTPVPGSEE